MLGTTAVPIVRTYYPTLGRIKIIFITVSKISITKIFFYCSEHNTILFTNPAVKICHYEDLEDKGCLSTLLFCPTLKCKQSAPNIR